MEYNPLDLLASAAELQQRHDDPPIMTRPRKAKTLTSKIITINSVQKENKDASKTSNKNGGVIVVKKIKIGGNSDLEKMLDEHNYGNAKKGIKYEKNLQTVSNDGLTPEIDSSVASERDYEATDNSVESNKSESIENLPVDKHICNDSTVGTSQGTKCPTIQSCTNQVPDTLPLVETEKTDCTKFTSSEDCPTNELIDTSKDSLVNDEGVHSPDELYPCDTIQLQNDELKLEQSKQEVCEGKNTDIKRNHLKILPADEKLDPVSYSEKVDIKENESNNSFKKVIVKFSPENHICIEEKDLNEDKKKNPVMYPDSSKAGMNLIDEMEACTSNGGSYEENSVLPNYQTSLVKDQSASKSVNIIRSLLTSDTVNYRNVKNAKLNNCSLKVNCDKENYLSDLEEKINSCGSPKSSFDLDPFCNSSSNGIHLLSPDRRNPDSVGIVESPVTCAFPDGSNSSESAVINASESLNSFKMETDIEKDECSSPFNAKTNSSTLTSEVADDIIKSQSKVKGLDQKGNPDKGLNLEKFSDSKDTDEKNRTNCEKVLELEQECHQSRTNSLEKQDNVFRFENDHCYAGLPGKTSEADTRQLPADEETDSDDEDVATSSPSVSPTELSQDSGYGDISQSPDYETKSENSVPHTAEKLVPVLISISKSGSLTVHTDKGISKELPRQIFTLSDNHKAVDSNANVINTNKAQNLNKTVSSSVRPLLLSPIGKGTASVLIDPSKIIMDPKSMAGIVSPPAKGLILQNSAQQVSPPKFGKFRIGTFASFSNTGMDLDSPIKNKTKNDLTAKTSQFSRTTTTLNNLPSFRSQIDKNQSSWRQTSLYKGSTSSGSTSPVVGYVDHIQHDHDYCVHSLMPSTIDSAKENNTQKENFHKSKSGLVKAKKSDLELQKTEKTNRRKGKSVKSLVEKEESMDEMEVLLDEERYRDLPTFAETVRAKTRTEKYIEQKSSEPKMKITGSSSFQDQFVYFMNTKKRSRRRESRDSHTPLQVPFDRILLPPPKPGDIVVPHLTDADIENLKLCNKQSKPSFVSQPVHSESFSSKLTVPNSSQSASSETNGDEESKIINTILSLENENEFLPEEQVYGNIEMYGQSGDVNLLPEQMNLTQEQMELLFSAVDEVQNSSPSLVSDKLATPVSNDPTFGQFPVEEQTYPDPLVEKRSFEKEDNADDGVVSADTSTPDQICTADKESPESPVITGGSMLEDGDKRQLSSCSLTTSDNLVTETPVTEQKKSVSTEVTTHDSPSNLPADTTYNSKSTSALSDALHDTVSKELFSNNSSSNSDSPVNSLNSGSTSSLTFPNIPSAVNHDLPLPSLDKSSLDILGNEYRLDRSDLFPDASLQETTPHVSGSYPVPTPLDYDAPWIVTVSMYWNDLPAIMINNLPFVRLVDIHKQILPAKDTGILKKRCQLMGIEVGNCTEMQRYFLVQYGKAVNSKSTLIISKDAAKVLIGYYVDPQPAKCPSSGKEHKSIIEHRREQLRRIALAKRAALRAERLEKERVLETKAGSNLLKPVETDRPEPLQGAQSAVPVTSRKRPQSLSRFHQTLSPGTRLQRSTRHKKINFLELLRGDSSSSVVDEDQTAEEENSKKKPHHIAGLPSLKPGSKRKGHYKPGDSKPVKVVKYKYLESSESSEEESSEYNEDDAANSSESEKEVKEVKKKAKKRTCLFNTKSKKSKYKKSVVIKRNVVKIPSFKVKLKSLSKLPSIQMSKVQVNPGETAVSQSKTQIENVKMNTDSDNSIPNEDHVNDDSDSPKVIAEMNEDSVSPKVIVEMTETHVSPKVIVETVYGDLKEIKCDDALCERESSLERTPEPKTTGVIVNSIPDSLDSDHGLDSASGEGIVSKQTPMDISEQTNQGNKNSESDTHKVQLSEPDNENVSVANILDSDSGEQQIQVDTEVSPLTSCSSSKNDKSVVTKNDEASNIKSDVNDTGNIESGVNHGGYFSGQVNSSDIVEIDSGKKNDTKSTNLCSDIEDTSVENVNLYFLNKQSNMEEEASPLRIFHRDINAQNSTIRSKRQLGEVFVEQYNNKRSFCIRCYTCRKMMSVDNFMRHLHDVSGGLIATDVPQTIEPSDPEMTDRELKAWEVFQRKKELFDNNQLPSDVARSSTVYNVDSDSNQSFVEKSVEENTRGPIIIQTPVSPVKAAKVKSVTTKSTQKKKVQPPQPRNSSKSIDRSRSWNNIDGVRASSRKRKASQLYSSDEYTFFKKLPRLQSELKEGIENAIDSP